MGINNHVNGDNKKMVKPISNKMDDVHEVEFVFFKFRILILGAKKLPISTFPLNNSQINDSNLMPTIFNSTRKN